MPMTPRERIEAVYRGDRPDQVPFMLDLSHWFYHKNRLPWDLSKSYERPEYELIDYHKKNGVGFYMPNLASFYKVDFPEDVKVEVLKDDGGRKITWKIETPLGIIQRSRVWDEISYSWAISDWNLKNEEQLKILKYALANRTFTFLPDKYNAWKNAIGDIGVCYVPVGYSAMGQLLNYWMGITGTIYATMDWPDTLADFIQTINANNLELVDCLAASPAEFILMGDNFSSDVQPPHFFEFWSKAFYVEAVRRLHKAGKFVAVHIDGRLSGAIKMISDTQADCADAVTPTPMGDLTPQQCRDEAGPDFILSGGVSPNLWLPETSRAVFEKGVLDWLALKGQSFRFIANAGDQVPPNAVEERIEIMRDIVAKHGC